MTAITGVSGERVCDVDDVPLGEGREATVRGRRVAVFHTEDGWYAVDAACPHRGGPLADGIVGGRSVTCPLHERRFDLAGGAPLRHDCPALRTYTVTVADGEVHVQPTRRGE
jgi:nitrite reductase (NADH) small subunit